MDLHNPRRGLEACRVYVNVAVFVLPVLLASLAFVTPEAAYTSQGAFCSLPVRPLWVRLSLSWIPRYIVFITILAFTMAVYIHVGKQFSSFRQSWTPSVMSSGLLDDERKASSPNDWRRTLTLNKPPAVRHASLPETPNLPISSRQTSRLSTGMRDATELCNARRSSLPNFQSLAVCNPRNQPHRDVEAVEAQEQTVTSGSQKHNSPLWTSPTWIAPIPEHRRESTATMYTKETGSTTYLPGMLSFGSSDMMFNQPSNIQSARSAETERKMRRRSQSVRHSMKRQRKLMVVQLRMTFLYPIVYIFLWTIPFILHCMQFSDRYVCASPPVLAALSTLCIAGMGGAMCVVFMVREKPWRALQPLTCPCSLETEEDTDQPLHVEAVRSESTAAVNNTVADGAW